MPGRRSESFAKSVAIGFCRGPQGRVFGTGPNKALDPSGDRRSAARFLYNLGKRLRQLYAGSTDPKDEPLLNLTWDYDQAVP
jgi:hypothetical protein